MRNNENIVRTKQSSENLEDNKKKFIRWIALSVFLMAITILQSYEAIDFRYRKSVELSENPVDYQLKAGDVIEQKLIVDKGDRVDDLRIWLSAYAETENKGTLQVTLAQGGLTEKSKIDTARIVGGGVYRHLFETDEVYGRRIVADGQGSGVGR